MSEIETYKKKIEELEHELEKADMQLQEYQIRIYDLEDTVAFWEQRVAPQYTCGACEDSEECEFASMLIISAIMGIVLQSENDRPGD